MDALALNTLPLLSWMVHPWGLAVLGLMVGSFLNVVVRRWPLIMERQWWADVAAQLQDGSSLQRVTARHAGEEVGSGVGASVDAGMASTGAQAALARACAAQGQALEAELDRLPALSLSRPGSHCPACGHHLRVWELIPVWSWLWLRGRCSACGSPIGWRMPLTEAATAGLFVAMGWRWGPAPEALMWGLWAAALLALALIDWDTLLLPDGLTQPLLWAGLGASALGWTIEPERAVGGAALGWLSLWSVATVFRLLRGREGMGAGDFKLLAALGAWLGPAMLIPVVLMASLGGAVVGLALQARGELREGRYVPFGPFLAAAGVAVALVSPQEVLRWWGLP